MEGSSPNGRWKMGVIYDSSHVSAFITAFIRLSRFIPERCTHLGSHPLKCGGMGGISDGVMYGFWWVRKEGCCGEIPSFSRFSRYSPILDTPVSCRCDGMSERDVRNVLLALGARCVRQCVGCRVAQCEAQSACGWLARACVASRDMAEVCAQMPAGVCAKL
eukprot:1196228-Prorocentrum_minimum.AAC.5